MSQNNCSKLASFEITGPLTVTEKIQKETGIDFCESFAHFFEMIDDFKERNKQSHKIAKHLLDCDDVDLRLHQLGFCDRFNLEIDGESGKISYTPHKFCIDICEEN